MRHPIFFCLLFLLSCTVVSAQRVIHTYKDKDYMAVYYTNDGRLDGTYTSYYTNGKKRSSGTFRNNTRHWNWLIYDSTGRMVRRQYSDPFTYTSREDSDSQHKRVYTLQRDSSGCYSSFLLKEKTVMVSKRLWRVAREQENPLLFSNQRLQRVVNAALHNGITAYGDDQFRHVLRADSLLRDTSNLRVTGWKIKEDWVFDSERKISELRIIGLCPEIVRKNSNDTVDWCWLYYPYLRSTLAREKISVAGHPEIQHLDDLFFFHDFASTIVKESNVYDRSIKDYAKTKAEQEKESERITIDMIEMEHDLWLKYAGH